MQDNAKILTFFTKGQEVSLTGGQMDKLFTLLIEELNRIGKVYYGSDPGFSFERPLGDSGSV